MRGLAIATLLLAALPMGSMADKPRVSRAMIKAVEESLDNRLQRLFPGDPVEMVGVTQGVYVDGYGVVFMGEVNLAPGAGISPFHPKITADEVKRIHDKKQARLGQLKETMADMLAGSAKSLDALPADEQITLGISLFCWNWEDTAGLPAQIVMHAPRRVLLQGKAAASDKLFVTSEEF
ncbi:MAG TPA: hypothetical protein VEV17_04275 [Bryobacteraceae bacterium]|nr:hypothetical protein [Bryobacteraceae bacterium]